MLRPMTHEASTTMVYDERYMPLLKLANLATVARVCRRGTPPFNPVALTALIDRWRPETHNFHLPCGEMTVTLEDVAMILESKSEDQQITKIHTNPNDQQITNPNDTYNKQRTLMTKITRNQTNLTCSAHKRVKQQCTQST